MKVKDTDIEKIHSTLYIKIMNFTQSRNLRYMGSFQAIEHIKRNFPSVLCPSTENDKLIDPEILVWCEEKFGDDWIWNWSTIFFKNEKDKIYFMLRWS